MEKLLNKTVIKAIGMSNVAGIRSQIPLAVLSNYYSKHPSQILSDSQLDFIQKPATTNLTKLLSTLEIGGDKIPGAPDRTVLLSLVPRIASGALIGAAIFQAEKENLIKGAIIGGVSALVATFASSFARKFFGKLFSLKNPVAGAIEDALAIGSSSVLMRI